MFLGYHAIETINRSVNIALHADTCSFHLYIEVYALTNVCSITGHYKMPIKKNLVIVIDESDEEEPAKKNKEPENKYEEPGNKNKEVMHPDFPAFLEKKKKEGTVDPDYAAYLQMLMDKGEVDPAYANFLEIKCKEDSANMPSSSAYMARKKKKDVEVVHVQDDHSNETDTSSPMNKDLLFRGINNFACIFFLDLGNRKWQVL